MENNVVLVKKSGVSSQCINTIQKQIGLWPAFAVKSDKQVIASETRHR